MQQLRKSLQAYSTSNDATELIELLHQLEQDQRQIPIDDAYQPHNETVIKREDLRLVCYEYVYA